MTDKLLIDCATGEAELVPLSPEEEVALAGGQAAADAAALEAAWEELYRERGLRLDGSDWIIEPWPADLPDSVQDEIRASEDDWAAYRQALRDLPEATADPREVVWPEPPPAPLLAITPQAEALEARRRRRQ
jgi:hypothetical protein